MKIGSVILALGIWASAADLRAQGTTTSTTVATTTTKGAFTEFVPASETIVVRTETNPAPLRYIVTKQTTIVDEGGVPVAIEKITPGNPLSVQYTGTGDRLVASRIVVHKTPVATERITTTTTTTRPLTGEEKKAVKEEVEKRKEQVEKASEKEKEQLEELKDKLEDDDK